jgi:hypothetical protein
LAKLASLQQRRERQIWDVLVAYTNAGTGGGSATNAQQFKTLVSASLDWIGGDYDDIQVCPDLEELVASRGVKLLSSGQAEIEPAMKSLADRYRSKIRQVLTWLSDPQQHRDLAVHAADFLRIHGTNIRMHLEANPRYDEGEDRTLVSEWPDHIGSVVSGVCRFILDHIERHDDEGERLRDAMPIGLCEKPGCGKFFVIQRVGRGRFCSSLCRSKDNQAHMTKKEKAERMRRYRQDCKDMSRKPIRFAKKTTTR